MDRANQSPMRLKRLTLCVLFVVGCGGGGGGGGVDGGQLDAGVADAIVASSDATVDGGVDPSDELFRPDHVVEVSITLAAADWAVLRSQPEQIGLPHDTCASQPGLEPYTDFPADITVDGVTVTNVAVRKKGGFGSISTERPGLKVDAHQYVPGQRIFGLTHLTLNNNKQDDTYISQCLGYGLFHAAGLPASRCNFAHVTVNGEDLGVYSNVETIKKQFLARNFGDDAGHLYESGGEFTPGATGGFQPKNDGTPPDCSDLDPVVTALAAPDATLEAQLGAVLDLDEFTRYWAMEVITDHWDGYANNQNNFYFYDDPTSGKFEFIPWGIDNLFTGRVRTTRPMSVFACGSLAWRLYDVPATRAKYLSTLRDLLQTVWNEPAILQEIARMQALLEPLVDPAGTGDFAAKLDATRNFVSTRAGVLLAELDAGDPVWPYPAGAESCRPSLGTVSATFDTTWDTLDTFGVGSGTMSGTIGGVDVTSSTVYASAGIGGDGKPTIQLFALLPDGRYAVLFVIIQDPANVTPGTRAIDLANVASIMTFYDPPTDTASGGGLLLPGTLDLTSASAVPDAPIAGSVTGDVLEL